jgi:hypothetical protein
METGLLPAAEPAKQELIAARVRKRLKRGEKLRLVAEQYPTYRALPQADSKKGRGMGNKNLRQT